MKFYEVNLDHTEEQPENMSYASTLEEAHQLAKKVETPVYRANVRITEVEVPTAKTYVCALLNMALGSFDRSPTNVIAERGRQWSLTARGGLKPLGDSKEEG